MVTLPGRPDYLFEVFDKYRKVEKPDSDEARKMLTQAQAEVIRNLVRRGCVRTPFTPLDAFPERNNKHNGCRRVLRNLARKGIIETVQVPDPKKPSVLMAKYVLGVRAETELKKFRR